MGETSRGRSSPRRPAPISVVRGASISGHGPPGAEEGVRAMATSVRRAGSGLNASIPGAIVLEASVTPPRVRPEHVPRPRLGELLGAVPEPKLVLVAAPPGFGKSTFLADWASSREGRVA